jgi:hypothetical protein
MVSHLPTFLIRPEIRAVLMIRIKAGLDGKLGREAARERARQRVLEELDRKLGAAPE